MEKVIRAIGALLLVGVLFLGIMTYANVTGISNILNYIKAGVDKLTGWLVPSDYKVSITPLGNASLVSGTKTVVLTVSKTGSYDIASVSISTDKALKVALKVEAPNTMSVTFNAKVTESNAVVVKEVEQTGINSYILVLKVYPAFDEAKTGIPQNVTSYKASVTVTISATVSSITEAGNIIVAVSEATYI